MSAQASLRTISSRPISILLRSFAGLEDDAILRRHSVVAAASGPRVNFAATIANENDLAGDGLGWSSWRRSRTFRMRMRRIVRTGGLRPDLVLQARPAEFRFPK